MVIEDDIPWSLADIDDPPFLTGCINSYSLYGLYTRWFQKSSAEQNIRCREDYNL